MLALAKSTMAKSSTQNVEEEGDVGQHPTDI